VRTHDAAASIRTFDAAFFEGHEFRIFERGRPASCVIASVCRRGLSQCLPWVALKRFPSATVRTHSLVISLTSLGKGFNPLLPVAPQALGLDSGHPRKIPERAQVHSVCATSVLDFVFSVLVFRVSRLVLLGVFGSCV